MISTRNVRSYNSVLEETKKQRQNEGCGGVDIYKQIKGIVGGLGFQWRSLAVLTRLRSHAINPERRRERRERLDVKLSRRQRATTARSCPLPRQARGVLEVIAVRSRSHSTRNASILFLSLTDIINRWTRCQWRWCRRTSHLGRGSGILRAVCWTRGGWLAAGTPIVGRPLLRGHRW